MVDLAVLGQTGLADSEVFSSLSDLCGSVTLPSHAPS